MKISFFFMVGSFAHNQQAKSPFTDSGFVVHSKMRHWAMPNYRQMGTAKVVNELVRPQYNRVSYRRNQDLRRIMESLDEGPRISSIWHSYTKNLF